ncbi:hypothetical protein FIBSPDRAFT_368717 [Athelia psychrophila]|uniref:Elongation factor methyltransferase 7 n=1 Tax=Athelia psychrophila TaxID=1759441 RepID=A0A166P9C9_9AGAM|nr:hypothetical protein FIBSPDRAFT_368717 [Fibularhizoctonia sp. CBS 109695]
MRTMRSCPSAISSLPPTPEPTVTIYERDPQSRRAFRQAVPESEIAAEDDWEKIEIKLVGKTELWGHYLWNAARAFTTFLDENPQLYRGRNVLELGAAGGLPGIVAAKNGARKVVLTDYDEPLINNLKDNIKTNFGIARGYGEDEAYPEDRISAIEYRWGQTVVPLLDLLPKSSPVRGFDVIILSDLVFNHSQHIALLQSCLDTLAPHPSNCSEETKATVPAPVVLVFYSHHVPRYADRDLRLFVEAKERGWVCEEMAVEKYPPMFPEDPGSEEVRSTVHRWKLTR